MSKRLDYIDVAKALAMILVIIAHGMSSNTLGMIFLGIVYSFHMPLFFMCSGITYKESTTFNEWKDNSVKSLKRLYCPAIVLFLIKTVYSFYRENKAYNVKEVLSIIKSLIWASGGNISVGGVDYISIGMMWFLVAFCIGRILFDIIIMKYEALSVWIISMFGMIGVIAGNVYPMPMCLDVSLAIMPLFYVGYMMKKTGFANRILIQPLALKLFNLMKFSILWIIVIVLTRHNWMDWIYLNISARRYPFFPLCYVGAVFGTITMFYISSLFIYVKHINSLISFFGKNTVIILYVHYLDNVFEALWNVKNHQFLTGGLRTVLDFMIAFVIITIKKWIIGRKIQISMIDRLSN